jgi:hypothetical protein
MDTHVEPYFLDLKPGVQDFFFGYHMVAVSANGGM